jgi:hypothetical protein
MSGPGSARNPVAGYRHHDLAPPMGTESRVDVSTHAR